LLDRGRNTCFFKATQKLQTCASGAELEYYYNNVVDINRNLLFADVDMDYKWKQMNFSLSWTSIFNTRNYVKSYYNGINQYNYVYAIRPTNVMLKVKFKIK